ncbi:PAS domain-containing protein [Luteitalea sp.]|jgi:PAS domain S-box-containing protein|uniref:PAS domain-containing protein n=1 Tax=Luteitalea sp. TaxID=2004800 RepID=UPI0037C50B13
MAFTRPTPTGHERFFATDDVIVSKTDLTGKITYANDVFLKIAGYEEHEVLWQPHSIIRHPDMPRAVFKYMWDTLGAEKEIFAYVINMAKNGDHYWVFAHVTPTFGADGRPIGYHSNRRVPDPGPVAKVKAIYAALLEEERKYTDKRQQLDASMALLVKTLQGTGMDYDEFVWSLAA